MNADQRLLAVQGIEQQFRHTLAEVTEKLTEDEDERFTVAAAVVTLMLRRMYQAQGEVWLTEIVKAVMAP